MKIWIQCRSQADAQFFEQAVIEGYFGEPLACQISPLNPCSLDVNFRSFPVDDEKIRIISFLVEWDYYEEDLSCEDHLAVVVKTNIPQPADLRRGVLLRMRSRKASG
ncbi:MAG: hypothetical protein ABI643_01255 [Candidatus Doudnabacteria bacterium]